MQKLTETKIMVQNFFSRFGVLELTASQDVQWRHCDCCGKMYNSNNHRENWHNSYYCSFTCCEKSLELESENKYS